MTNWIEILKIDKDQKGILVTTIISINDQYDEEYRTIIRQVMKNIVGIV